MNIGTANFRFWDLKKHLIFRETFINIHQNFYPMKSIHLWVKI